MPKWPADDLREGVGGHAEEVGGTGGTGSGWSLSSGRVRLALEGSVA